MHFENRGSYVKNLSLKIFEVYNFKWIVSEIQKYKIPLNEVSDLKNKLMNAIYTLNYLYVTKVF